MGKVIALFGLLLLAGCQTAKGSFCDIAPVLRPSQAEIEAMTEADRAERLAYLEKGARLCGWRP